jgi:hypothetical protein
MSAMERAPITKIRSEWMHEPTWGFVVITGVPAAWSSRRVSDGLLRALVAEEPMGWHMSISFVDHRGKPSRYPRWDEIAHARDELLPADVEFVMFLPRSGEYVALHDTTFHLHEHPARDGET